MTSKSVLIVGAGPTGMVMAIELKRAGFDVRIIDMSGHLARHSQALGVQARTLEQFQRYGIAEKAVARGRKLQKATIRSEGKTIVSVNFNRIPSRYPFLLFLPQSETEAILNELMESLGVRTERTVELASFIQTDSEVTASIRHPDGSIEEVNAAWLIGCDGAHSAVREKAGIPFEGGGVGVSFFLGDVELEGPDVPQDELVINSHAGDVVFMGRLTDKFTRVIAASNSSQNDSKPDATARNIPKRELTIQDFQDAMDKASLRITVKSAEWMTPFYVNDRQATHYRAGRVFLAGDASHIHSPVGGQGMNTGIQDAANLAWKLAAIARGADPSLLDSYEEERAEVGRALLRFTEQGLKIGTASSFVIEALRNTFLPWVTSLAPVQRSMLGFISETAIEYRSSSIVQDHGGDGSLHAGDRMPDLAFKSSVADTLATQRTLLANWTDGRHLALLVNPTVDESNELKTLLPNTNVVALHSSAVEDGEHKLGTERKLLIVRPDGYIGFRGQLENQPEIEAYARQDVLS